MRRPPFIPGTSHPSRWLAAAAIALAVLAALLGAEARQFPRRVPERLRDLVTLGDLITASESAARATRDYLLTGEEHRLRPLDMWNEQVERSLGVLEARGAIEPTEAAAHREAHGAIVVAAQRAADARRRTGRVVGETQRVVIERMLPARERVQRVQQRLRGAMAARHAAAVFDADAASSRAVWVLALGFAVGLLAAVLMARRAGREARERAQAERERAASLERERAARRAVVERGRLIDRVIEQSGDAVIVADGDGVIRVFNAEAERQHGVSRGEVAAPEWAATFGLLRMDGQPLPLEHTPLYQALHGRRLSEARWLVRRPDGSVRTLVGTASPLHGEDGRLEGAVLTARDETERLQLEAQRAEALAQLHALITSAPVGMALLDAELRYLHVNEVLAAFHRVPREAHLGRRVGEVVADVPLEPLLRGVLETGEPVLDHELRLPDGRHFLASYFPVRPSRDRAAIGVGGVVVEITALKHAEDQMRRAVEVRERFAAILGHDLRSPLNAIHMAAQLLLVRGSLDESARTSVQRILSSAGRMARMIAELLDVTRIRLGAGLPVRRRVIDLGSTCRDIVEEVEAAHPERSVELRVEGDATGEWDPDLLAQVVSNLVGNAVEHGAADVPIRVRLDGRAHDEVALSVHNGGTPIPRERIAEIFEPFRRASEPHSREGLGLGLYIARQIVIAHGGTLEACSRVDEGTTFESRLPRHPRVELRSVSDTRST